MGFEVRRINPITPQLNMLRNRTNIFAKFYLIAIILYISQGILFEGTWFTFLSGLYLLSFNMYAMLKVLVRQHRSLLFSLLIIIIGWIIFLWFISSKSYRFEGEVVSTMYMVEYSIIVFSSFFSFYYISINSLVRKYHLRAFILFLGVIYVYNVLNYDVANASVGDYDFSTVNNKSYSIVALFPLLSFFWDKKWFMLLLMTMALFFVTFCLKRGAIIIAASYYMVSIIYVFIGRNKNVLNKRFIQLLVLALVAGVVYALMSIYNSNDLIQARIELTLEGSSSGRDYIYAKIWKAWEDSSLIFQVIGHGPISTLSAAPNYAHNDWLEILYDFGILGLLLYLAISVYLFKYWKKNKMPMPHKLGILMCLLYIILRSSFSMCIYELDSLLVFGYIGYIMGDNYLRQKEFLMMSINKNEVK